jgi:erythromycin esterase-like protein
MRTWHWIAGCIMALAATVTHAAPPTPYTEAAIEIDTHAGDHRLLVLGELHGTRETPLLVRALVDHYAATGVPVRLALELPVAENTALETYITSDGDAASRHALRTTNYWTVKDRLHDGRRSEDMLDLIEAVRLLRAEGRDISVAGFDRTPNPVDAAPGTRDADMAKELRDRYATLPAHGRLLVLTGNMHGMRSPPAQLGYPTATALLNDLPLYNVRIEARGGEFWGCKEYRRCGSLPLITYTGTSPKVDIDADREYDLMIFLPRFTVARLLDAPQSP